MQRIDKKLMALQQKTITVEGKEWCLHGSPMDTVYIPDKGGNSLLLQRIGGKLALVIYEPQIVQGVRSLEMRDSDICLCAYPRTGSHWVFERMSMLLNGNAETIQSYKGKYQLEISPPEVLDAMSSPRALSTHMLLSEGPQQLVEKKCKIIYNVRDPKDVAVSVYNMYRDSPFCEYKGDFKDFLYLFLEGKVSCDGIFGHYLDAEKFIADHPDHPVHFHVYEEAIMNPLQEVQRLSDFMDLKRDDHLCQAIAEKCSFSRMVVDKEPYCVKFNGKNALYRKGVVGDWKNWFTDEMLEDYYQIYEEKMAGSRFYERYADRYANDTLGITEETRRAFEV